MCSQSSVSRIARLSVLWLIVIVGVPAFGSPVFVDDDAPEGGDGLSWATAFNNLDDALAVATDEIRVAGGVYKPGGTGDPRAQSFVLFDGIELRGGYAGFGAADPDERDVAKYETVLSGDIGTPGSTLDNSYTVVTAVGLKLATLIDGMTIRSGRADGPSPFNAERRGAGLFANGVASLRIHQCRFLSNVAVDLDGEGGLGGGLFCSNSNVIITRSAFLENIAFDGGGLYGINSLVTAVSMASIANTANRGGGLFQQAGSVELSNCVFAGNSAASQGGGVYADSGTLDLNNCTIVNNVLTGGAGSGGAGVLIDGTANDPTATVDNTVLWGNLDPSTASVRLVQLATPAGGLSVRYSCVEDAMADDGDVIEGPGNIDADPGIVDNEGRLGSGSPCFDAADNDALPFDTHDLDGDLNTDEVLPWDIDGRPRRTDDADADPDTGNPGTVGFPVVDMGAFEATAPTCVIDAPEFEECVGSETMIFLDGSDSDDPGHDVLEFFWEVDCPQGLLDDPTSPTPLLTVDTSQGCSVICTLTLSVDHSGGDLPFSCGHEITIADTVPPIAGDDFIVTDEDTPISIEVLANDSDAGAPIDLVIKSFTQPRFGVVVETIPSVLLYAPSIDFSGEDSFQYTVVDESGNTHAASVFVTIDPVADTPTVIVADAEGDEDAAIELMIDVQSGDADGSETLSVVISGVPAGAVLSAGTDEGGGTWALDEADIVGLTVTHAADSHDDFTLFVSATATESANGDTAASAFDPPLHVTVNPVNDAPVIEVPTMQTVDEDAELVILGVSVDDIDVDEGTGIVEVSLVSGNGIMSLAGTEGLSFMVGDGTDDAEMTFQGTLADINGALAGLSFAGDLDFNGDETVAVLANDLGNTGSGGPLVSGNAIVIDVLAVNDPPSVSVPGTQFVDEDEEIVIMGVAVDDVDVDEGGGTLEITLSAGNGLLSLETVEGLSFQVGDGVLDPSMVFTGSVTDVGAALANLLYLGDPNYFGDDQVSITVSDMGNTGSGGELSDTDDITIVVAPVNDPPTAVDDPDGLVTTMGIQLLFSTSAMLANDFDVDGDFIDLIAINQPANGTIEDNGGGFLPFTYTPNPGFVGIDTFVYTISDFHGGTDSATTSIAVLPDGKPIEVAAIGPRYLEITSLPDQEPTALQVTSPDEPCFSLYVQAPELINGKQVSRLAVTPVFLTASQWGIIRVSDVEILPATTYNINIEFEAGGELSGESASTWPWADVNNSGGSVDFDDVLCQLDGFSGMFVGSCSFFGSDLEGTAPNVIIDFDDVVATLDAFAGAGYFDSPTHVDPCP